MRGFRNLSPTVQLLILSGVVFVVLAFYIPLSKYIKPTIVSLQSATLEFSQDVSSHARQFLRFQDLTEENRILKQKINKLTGQLVQLQEDSLENQRLRKLLSLPQRQTLRTQTALVMGKDSSNWTRTVLLNKGTASGIKKGLPVVLGTNLVGKVIEAASHVSKVILIIDFNSKVPAKIVRSREEGVVFGTYQPWRAGCKMKYIQGEIKPGDQVITSGLGGVYPKGLLIGEVRAVEVDNSKLYKIAEIQPLVELENLEEVMIIITP